jgi:hypothetical protein
VPASTICRQFAFGIVGGLLSWNASNTCNDASAICGSQRSPGKNESQIALFSVRHQRLAAAAALRLRVWAAFFAEAERAANERDAAAAPPL